MMTLPEGTQEEHPEKLGSLNLEGRSIPQWWHLYVGYKTLWTKLARVESIDATTRGDRPPVAKAPELELLVDAMKEEVARLLKTAAWVGRVVGAGRRHWR